MGRVTHIVRGHQKARAIYGTRSYERFRHRVDAEEFAAWWNYRRDQFGGRQQDYLASLSTKG
jgi:hypothetical protein